MADDSNTDEFGTPKPKPSAEPRSKTNDTLSRLRAKRAGNTSTSSSVEAGKPSTDGSAMSAADKRKLLKQMRERARQSTEGPDSVSTPTGRSTPGGMRKSNSKQFPSFRGSLDFGTDDPDESAALLGTQRLSPRALNAIDELQKYFEEWKPVTAMESATEELAFPLSFFPKTMDTEKELNARNGNEVVLPMARPDIYDRCVECLSVPCCCCRTSNTDCCNINNVIDPNGNWVGGDRGYFGLTGNGASELKENQFVTMNIARRSGAVGAQQSQQRLLDWLAQQQNKSNALLAVHKRVKRAQLAANGGLEVQPEYLDYDGDAGDGIFVENPPVYADLLMSTNEVVSNPIVDFAAPNLLLSRATQRTLRDLHSGIADEKIRRKIELVRAGKLATDTTSMASEVVTGVEPGRKKPKQQQRTPEEQAIDEDLELPDDENGSDAKSATRRVPPAANLLHLLDSAPMLRVHENIVVDDWEVSASQPVVPVPSRAYGGQLGQWPNSATREERLGPLPPEWGAERGIGSDGGPSAVMRVHLHQLCITEHPLMCEEERTAVHLREMFAKYRTLFVQRTLEFLMYRLSSLIGHLQSAVSALSEKRNHHNHELNSDSHSLQSSNPEGEDDEDEVETLMHLYKDLIETLPALNELNDAVGNLTKVIYRGWRQLQKIRAQQGYNVTNTLLTARRLHSNLSTSERAVGDKGKGFRSRRKSKGSNAGDDATGLRKKLRFAGDGRDSGEENSVEGSAEENEEAALHNLPDGIQLDKGSSGVPSRNESVSDIVWQKLRGELESLPGLLGHAQELLFRDVLHPQHHSPRPVPTTRARTQSIDTCDSGSKWGVQLSEADEQRQKEKLTLQKERLQRVMAAVNTAVNGLIESEGLLPPYILRLSDEDSVTQESQLPAQELHRRHLLLKSTQIKVVIKVNGKVVTTTGFYSLRFPTYVIDFKKYFEFRVTSQPRDVTLDIIASTVGQGGYLSIGSMLWSAGTSWVQSILGDADAEGGAAGNPPPPSTAAPGSTVGSSIFGAGGVGSHVLASVSLAVPAAGSKLHGDSSRGTGKRAPGTYSFVPTSGWYGFATRPPAPTSSGAPVFDHALQGGMYCSVEYDIAALGGHVGPLGATLEGGLRLGDTGVLPQPLAAGKGGDGSMGMSGATVAGSGRESKINNFARELDFQSLLPDRQELDLNDPRNDHLLYLMSQRPDAEADIFRLSGTSDYAAMYGYGGFAYGNYAKFRECNRMKLLRLRAAKPYRFSEPIPLSEQTIRSSEVYQGLLAEAQRGKTASDSLVDSGGDIDEEDENEVDYDVRQKQLTGQESANAAKVNNFLARVRNSQAGLNRKVKRKQVSTSSLVLETDFLPPLNIESFLWIFERRRALRPKARKRIPVGLQMDACELLVQVVGGKNVPLRAEMELSGKASADVPIAADVSSVKTRPRAGSTENAVEGAEQPLVNYLLLDQRKLKEKLRARTFVEIRFQENKQDTTRIDGPTPRWKQSLSLPFHPPQADFTPNNLVQVRDDVYFTLFDELYEDDAGRGGFLEGESTVRVERRYLGSFSVPFSTIWQEGKIQGAFRLNTPVMNFGYDHAESVAASTAQRQQGMFATANDNDDNESDDDEDPQRETPTVSQLMIRSLGNTNGQENQQSQQQYNGGVLTAEAGLLLYPVCSPCWTYFACVLACQQMQRTIIEAQAPVLIAEPQTFDKSYMHSGTASELAYFASDNTATYIQLLITLDPVLVTPPKQQDDISLSNVIRQDKPYVAYSRRWLRELREIGEHTEHRTYKLFGVNSSGLNVLVCRYLCPQAPPKGFDSMRSCLHLVSTIPFMKDAQSFIGELDLWCTTRQFWSIGAGDEEEHAVMLFNYLSYLALQRDLANGVTRYGVQSTGDTGEQSAGSGLLVEGDAGGAAVGGDGGTTAPQNEPTVRNYVRRLSTMIARPFTSAPTPASELSQNQLASLTKRQQFELLEWNRLNKNSPFPGYPPDSFVAKESVFLVFGRAIPEGETVYVIVRDLRRSVSGTTPRCFLVINPCTGFVYSASDPNCPLREVHSLATSYNTWANIQTESAPSKIMYDILNFNNWRPFFGSRLRPPAGGLHTIQERISYKPTGAAAALAVEKAVFQAIRNSLRRWRSKRQRSTTTFHPDACAAMQDLLPKLERWKRKEPPAAAPTIQQRGGRTVVTASAGQPSGAREEENSDHHDDYLGADRHVSLQDIQQEVGRALQGLLRTRTLRGFPLNLPFTDVDEILKKVRSLCVHENNHPEVQFVLAVRAFPVYNNIVSVWVFIGSLEAKEK